MGCAVRCVEQKQRISSTVDDGVTSACRCERDVRPKLRSFGRGDVQRDGEAGRFEEMEKEEAPILV